MNLLWLWPWEECDAIFYGYIAPSSLHMDFSVPRCCNLPKDHRGSHDWWPIHEAGYFPRHETRYERSRRLRQEKRAGFAGAAGERQGN